MGMLSRGDLIWVAKYDAQGHELKGRHPAVVISPTEYNQRTKMAVICSITSVSRGNLFEIAIPDGIGISGVIKVDCISTIDWSARTFDVVGRLPPPNLDTLLDRLRTFLT